MLFYNIFFFPLSVPHHRQLPIYFLSLYISLYLLEPYTNGIMQCVFFFSFSWLLLFSIIILRKSAMFCMYQQFVPFIAE